MVEVLIRGGMIMDGLGGEPYVADISIAGGKIVEIGDLAHQKADHIIDSGGLAVAPGFIDSHSHDEFNLPVNPLAPGKVLQGVTTQITGQCGWSPAPILPAHKQLLRENAAILDSGLRYDWESMGEFLEKMPPCAQNIAQLVGHVALRCAVMGMENRPPTPSEMERMKALMEESLKGGAFGFSTGLVYPPSSFGNVDEIAELAKVAAKYGGGYHTHMRNESGKIFESIDEAAEVGKRSGAAVHISHLKISGKAFWGQAQAVLEHLENWRSQGIKLNWDQYPYPATSTGLKTILPQWAHEGGIQKMIERLQNPSTRDQIRAEILEGINRSGVSPISEWTEVMVSASPSNAKFNGKNLQELGDAQGKLPVDAALDLLLADYTKTLAIFFLIGVEDMECILAHPGTTIGSDGILTTRQGEEHKSQPHPRYYGSFPRVIGRYARDKKLLTPQQAVQRMSSQPAKAFGITDRGCLAPQMAADIVVFEPDNILDNATYKAPHQYPSGIQRVLVNGVVVAQNGEMTGQTPGNILTRL